MENKNKEGLVATIELDESVDSTNSELPPEKKLRFAIIERAVLDWLGKDKVQVRSAKEWILAPIVEKPDDHTFQSICSILDLDIDQMKKAIVLYVERKKIEQK